MCQPSGPGSIPGMSHSETAISRGNPIMLLSPSFHVLHAYMLNFLLNLSIYSLYRHSHSMVSYKRAGNWSLLRIVKHNGHIATYNINNVFTGGTCENV